MINYFQVEVVTRGLEAFGGGGGDASQTEEPGGELAQEPGGVLALAVGGARLPDIPLFNGQVSAVCQDDFLS